MTDLTVILPVYNQADIIETTFRSIYTALAKLNISFECILVENGSTDNTRQITRKLAGNFKFTRATSTTKGYGSGVISGLEISRGKYVCYMPSDGQVDLKVLAPLYKLAKEGQYQIVKVRRINRESFIRTLTSRTLSLVLWFFFRTPVIDINGSPRILTRENISQLRLHYRDSFIDSEMTIKAHRLGWKIHEIPMKNLDRFGGKSSRSYRTYLEFIKNVFTYRDN